MQSYQDIIDKQLKIVQEGGELINSMEFALICEADYYRPPGEKWYSKHRSLVSTGKKVGATVASVLTLGIYGKYRQWTDRCRQTCHGITSKRKDRCIAVCNMNASKRVVQLIKANKNKLDRYKDPEQRKKAKRIMDSELNKWESRYDKYQARVSSLSAMITQASFKRD